MMDFDEYRWLVIRAEKLNSRAPWNRFPGEKRIYGEIGHIISVTGGNNSGDMWFEAHGDRLLQFLGSCPGPGDVVFVSDEVYQIDTRVRAQDGSINSPVWFEYKAHLHKALDIAGLVVGCEVQMDCAYVCLASALEPECRLVRYTGEFWAVETNLRRGEDWVVYRLRRVDPWLGKNVHGNLVRESPSRRSRQ